MERQRHPATCSLQQPHIEEPDVGCAFADDPLALGDSTWTSTKISISCLRVVCGCKPDQQGRCVKKILLVCGGRLLALIREFSCERFSENEDRSGALITSGQRFGPLPSSTSLPRREGQTTSRQRNVKRCTTYRHRLSSKAPTKTLSAKPLRRKSHAPSLKPRQIPQYICDKTPIHDRYQSRKIKRDASRTPSSLSMPSSPTIAYSSIELSNASSKC